MPRRPLGELTPNIVRRRELTEFERGQIVGLLKNGGTPSSITKVLTYPIETIRGVIKRSLVHPTAGNIGQRGRKKATSERDKRLILRIVRKNPRA